MRDIIFRGRDKQGRWHYGSLVIANNFIRHMPKQHSKTWIVTSAFGNGGWFNVQNRFYVEPDSVGQYIGLKDEKGVRAFEGDIAKFTMSNPDTGRYVGVFTGKIVFGESELEVELNDSFWPVASWKCVSKFEIIGNATDNPELIDP